MPISAACRIVSGDAAVPNQHTKRTGGQSSERIPPMHAAKPALAIEQATEAYPLP